MSQTDYTDNAHLPFCMHCHYYGEEVYEGYDRGEIVHDRWCGKDMTHPVGSIFNYQERNECKVSPCGTCPSFTTPFTEEEEDERTAKARAWLAQYQKEPIQ